MARQSGNPGPTGSPAERTARRSGGNAKPNSASERANSASERPGWTWIPEFRRWVKTLSAREENERRPFRAGSDAVADGAAARAERRRRPATWAGFRPVILRSTSTIVFQKKVWFLLRVLLTSFFFFSLSFLLLPRERKSKREVNYYFFRERSNCLCLEEREREKGAE